MRWNTRSMSRRGTHRPPGPSYLTPFGPGRVMRRDPLAFVSTLARDYGDVVRLGMGPIAVYMLHHPDGVKHVLQDNHQNYVKGPVIARVKVLIGDGLFTSEGDFWLRQRRLAQPAFHRDRIAGFVGAMVGRTDERLAQLESAARLRDPIDVGAE